MTRATLSVSAKSVTTTAPTKRTATPPLPVPGAHAQNVFLGSREASASSGSIEGAHAFVVSLAPQAVDTFGRIETVSFCTFSISDAAALMLVCSGPLM